SGYSTRRVPATLARRPPPRGRIHRCDLHPSAPSLRFSGGSPMALSAAQIAEQKKQVEELIAGSDVGFAKALFFGKFKSELLFPYPTLPPEKQAAADEMADKVRDYADLAIDHMKIDRRARLPDPVIAGLG